MADRPAAGRNPDLLADRHRRCRVLGEPPPGAELAEPGVEDGYLLLTGERAGVVVA